MVEEHDYTKFPELSNRQIEVFGFTSPHKQITEDFDATVVKVHDGDTVTLNADFRDFDFPLRFLGIDAPELNTGEPGIQAKEWTESRLLNEDVQIRMDRKNRVDKYGRLLGRIFHLGTDVGEDEIRLGLATTFENRKEGQIPNINKTLAVEQWF